LQARCCSYLPRLPSPVEASALMRLSFLLTAAGQFRISTGFPFSTAMQNQLYRQYLHYNKEARPDVKNPDGRKEEGEPGLLLGNNED
jgi:hypothetical protein